MIYWWRHERGGDTQTWVVISQQILLTEPGCVTQLFRSIVYLYTK